MNKILLLIVGSILVSFIFGSIPYIFPTLTAGLYQPYELWIFALLIFYVMLPNKVGSYVYELKKSGN